MERGISLHIGLNRIDSTHYGSDGALGGCENDARAMQRAASSLGYETTTLLTTAATAQAILAGIRSAADQLGAGDTFLLTFAGHGAQLPDESGDEDDLRDETWCAYDRMILDDELSTLWTAFRPGVLVIGVSDSCHSGTVVRRRAARGPSNQPRGLSDRVALEVSRRHRAFYTELRRATPMRGPSDAVAAVIGLSACRDEQVAADGETNGLYTEKLLHAWDEGRFAGDYIDFVESIRRLMPEPDRQTPGYDANAAAARVLDTRPFAISSSVTSGYSTAPSAPVPAAQLASTATPPYPSAHCTGSSVATHASLLYISADLNNSYIKEDTMQALIDNGNWEEVAAALSRPSARDVGGRDFMAEVVAGNAAAAEAAHVRTAGAPVPASGNRGGSTFRAFWWGFHVEVSHQDLIWALNATDPRGEFVRFLRQVIPAQYHYWIDIIAPFVVATATLLRALDRGRGVYISMSWFAPGAFVPTSV